MKRNVLHTGISTIVALLVLGLCTTGCGDLSLDGSSSSSGNSLTTSNLTLPTNLKPAPNLEITSPDRATISDTSSVVLRGKVSDKYAITALYVNGQAMTAKEDGTFEVPVTLQPGMNILWAMAKNSEGGRSVANVSVMYGQYKKDTEMVDNAMLFHVNQAGLDKVAGVVKPMLLNLDLEQKIKALNPIYSGSTLWNTTTANINVNSLDYNNPTIDLKLGAGYLDTSIALNNLAIQVNVSGKLVGIGYSITGNVGCSRAAVSTDAHMSVTNGKMDVAFKNTSVTLEGFYWNINNFPSALTNLAKNAVKNLLTKQIKKLIDEKVPGMLKGVFANLNKPIKQNVFGLDLDISIFPKSVQFMTSCLCITLNGNVQVPNNIQLPADHPGSIHTPGLPPQYQLGSEMSMGMNDDLLNRVLHAAWKGGMTHLTLDDKFFQTFNVDTSNYLNASTLLALYPELIAHLNETDPLVIKLAPKLAPVIRMVSSPDLVELNIGECDIIIAVKQGALIREVVTLTVHIKAAATVSYDNGQLKIQILGKPEIMGDVTDEPLTDLNENKLELLLNLVVPMAVPKLIKSIQGITIPSFFGLAFDQLTIEQGGSSGDFLSMSGSLKTVPTTTTTTTTGQ